MGARSLIIGMTLTLSASVVWAGTPSTITNPANTNSATVDSSGDLHVTCDVGCSGSGGGGAVFGPTATGSPAANPPVLLGGTANGAGTGTVGVAKVDSSGNLSVNLSQISGAVPSITNPVWVANAEAADTTGTFTNGTQTTSITNSNADGYAAGLISINGTYGTASGVFEVSDDSGTTWYSVICGRSDGSASETGYTSLTNTNRQWSCPVGGNDSLRIRSTAVASGTVNARVGISAPPPSSTTTFGTLSPQGYTSTQSGSTVTTHLTFQSVLASNTARHGCLFQNTSADSFYVFFGATGSATTANSITLNGGQSINCASGGIVVTDNIAVTSKTTDGATYVVVSQ